jgi:Tol biopolymer transport system component
MGEVYRAKDTRLERTVAVKVLPSHLSSSPEIRQRFEREAKTISQLSHPHICALYDIGREGETEFLVMEYLEGESLSDRLGKGALPLEQSLRYGMEIADALDKAHRQGIVHRDLKPGNVMLTKSGVKLLDFGLAKLAAPTSGVMSGLSMLPTTPKGSNLTAEGTILGTLQYMAPEQLEGKEADARTDIFAFGSVLYEMATGKKAFLGTSQASLIGAILKDEPAPISTIEPMSPPGLDRIIKTCLAKDPERRWQSPRDVALELEAVSDRRETGVSAASRLPRRGRLLLGALVLALVVMMVFALFRRQPPAGMRTVRFNLDLPANLSVLPGAGLQVSPDGRQIVFAATSVSGQSQLYVRALDSLERKALPGTEEGFNPFWSTDGRRIGFFAGGKLKSIDLAGGRAIELADPGPGASGGAWMPDGSIVIGYYHAGLTRLRMAGGTVNPFLALDTSHGETSHRWPHLLPDGKHFVFLSTRWEGSASQRASNRAFSPRASSIDVIGTEGGSRRMLVRANSEAWVAGDFLIYARDGVLVAQRIDTSRFTLSNQPVIIQDPVAYRSLFGSMTAAATEDVLAYCATGTPTTRLIWLDRSGKELSAPGASGPFSHMDLAPDATHVALEGNDPHGLGEILIGDLSRDTFTRVIASAGTDWNWKPVWSSDGDRLIFAATRSNVSDLYVKRGGGTGPEELLFADPTRRLAPEDLSQDGRLLVFQKLEQEGIELWALPLTGEKKPLLLVPRAANSQASLSPDGRFLAYTSREAERPEVFVAPVPPSGERWQVSTRGGVLPRWRQDARELFYVAPDRELMAVPVVPGAAFRAGVPQRLFPVRISELSTLRRRYAPSPDGTRFLILSDVDEAPRPITVVMGWANGLLH